MNGLLLPIFSKIGSNHVQQFEFTSEVKLIQKNNIETIGLRFYTIKGVLYIIDNKHRHTNFDMYSKPTQVLIFQNILNNMYKKSKWYDQLHRK